MLKLFYSTIFTASIFFSSAVIASVEVSSKANFEEMTLTDTSGMHDERVQAALFYISGQSKKNYKDALRLLNDVIDGDYNPLAYRLRGTMYYKGLGVWTNKEKALEDFETSATENLDSAYMAGHMYLIGDSVKPDIEVAAEYLTLAANGGQVNAQEELAMFNLEQSRLEQNETLKLSMEKSAFHYGKMCAEKKNTNCMRVLAEVFSGGLADIKVSPEAARDIEKIAAELDRKKT